MCVRISVVLWAFVIGVLVSDQTDPEAPCVAVNPALKEFDMSVFCLACAASAVQQLENASFALAYC